MSKKPNASQNMALKAAAMVARQSEVADETPASPTAEAEMPATTPEVGPDPMQPDTDAADGARRGRPRGKRPVAARQTIYLDKPRHAALARIAEDRGRSVHSLILEGIDYVIQKPVKPGWQ